MQAAAIVTQIITIINFVYVPPFIQEMQLRVLYNERNDIPSASH